MASQSSREDDDWSLVDDLLQCAICLEPFTNPKMLQCGHTFCEKCLHSIYDANQQTNHAQLRKLSCPICREVTSVPADGIDGLRNDFKVHKMKTAFGRMAIRKRHKANDCDPCRVHNKIVAVKGYCSRCKVNYCEECLRKHNMSPLFKDHKVFEKSALQKLTFTEHMCKVHKGEDSCYFCQTCKTVACTMCVVDEHAEHDVANVNELYEQHMDVIRNLQKVIESKVGRQSNVKAKVEALRSQILQSYQQTEDEIKGKASMMIASIQKQEADLLHNLQQTHEQELGPLLNKLKMVESNMTDFHSLKDEVDSRNQFDILAEHDRLIKRLHAMAKSEETTCSAERSLKVSFLVGQQEPNVGRLEVVQRDLTKLCETDCLDVLLNSEQDQAVITKLTRVEIGQILSLENAFSVKVTIENRKPKKFIRIQGLKADTSQANFKISDIFRRIEVADVKKSQGSLIAKMVHWSYSEGVKFTDYPGDINSLLEKAYQANKRHLEWKEDNDETYRVDFKKMVETTCANHNGVLVKRTIIGGDIELPANWTRMGDGEHVKLELLHKSSGEYQMVEKDIMRTAGGSIRGVTKVERVQNPTLYRLYVLHRGDMEKRRKKPATTERSLWHGTSADAIGNINNGGFNRSYCGKNATMFGQGVCFAVNSSYSAQGYASPDTSGHKRMYKALVLAGDYTQGNSSMRYLPDNPNNPGFPLDSAVDKPGSPNMFVVFLDNMAYPEYLVTFT